MKREDNRARAPRSDRPDGLREQARDLRARVWRFVFDCYAKKAKQDESSLDRGEPGVPAERGGRT